MSYLLGIDLGSSSVKAALLNLDTRTCTGQAYFPREEMPIQAPSPGFAEQDPSTWLENARLAVRAALENAQATPSDVTAIGIAYQMHGLVCVDDKGEVLRPAIIWCDSRATEIGRAAFDAIGHERCMRHLLNAPGNFTAAKLAWVREHEPDIFKRIDNVMLPGDWLAMKLTGRAATTASGLSEGMFWDHVENGPAEFLLDHLKLPHELLCPVVPTFGEQGKLTHEAADLFGLAEGTPVTYRAGDQPNNALSLNVLEPGEIAATAGTSGVVFGVTEKAVRDTSGRINSFLHVNHTASDPRTGLLLCINGAGSFNAWMRRQLGDLSYSEIDEAALTIPAGSEGLTVLPFGNGAERMLSDRNIGAHICGIDVNRHGRAHTCRAALEGVACAFGYGIGIMNDAGMKTRVIRAGNANMFLSRVFSQTVANLTGARIELYETDGALGAARGAGIGAGLFDPAEAFHELQCLRTVEPEAQVSHEFFIRWKERLDHQLQQET